MLHLCPLENLSFIVGCENFFLLSWVQKNKLLIKCHLNTNDVLWPSRHLMQNINASAILGQSALRRSEEWADDLLVCATANIELYTEAHGAACSTSAAAKKSIFQRRFVKSRDQRY